MQSDRYDVVVIGSGIGGMCAAALAVQAGYRTLVVEAMDRIGGRFSTEEIDCFKLVTGAHMIHRNGWVPRIFEEVGAKLEILDMPGPFFLMLRGKEYPLPPGNWVEGFLNIANEMERHEAVHGRAGGVPVQLIMNSYAECVADPSRAGGLTVREWHLQYTGSKDVHDIFDTLCLGWAIGHAYEVPASVFFEVNPVSRAMGPVGVAPGGNLQNIERLAEIVRARGDLWTGSPATRISVKKGMARSVVVNRESSGEVELECKAIVSDVGPVKTAMMAGHDHYGEDYLKRMRVRMRPMPVTVAHIASDRPLLMTGGERGAIRIVGARRFIGGATVTNVCPDLAPPGQHYLKLAGHASSTLASMDRDEEIRQCMLDLKELLPDFEKHGRILKIDVKDIDDDLPEGRSWQAFPYQMPQETPIRNLWNVGDGALSRGLVGSSGSAEGAKRTVDAIKARIEAG